MLIMVSFLPIINQSDYCLHIKVLFSAKPRSSLRIHLSIQLQSDAQLITIPQVEPLTADVIQNIRNGFLLQSS